jgi:hypothetical protein
LQKPSKKAQDFPARRSSPSEKKLVVQELAGGPPLTIFTAPEIGYLRWSPDGKELIVWARGAGKNGVYVMPQLGGTPRRIADDEFIGCWSPDGATIAVAGYKGKMSFFDKLGGELRTVSLRASWSVWDIDWSAKGVLWQANSVRLDGRRSIARLDGRCWRWNASSAVVGEHERHVRSHLGARVADSLPTSREP